MREKIVRLSIAKQIVNELKQQGKKVVFTNGCFDILHIGHLRYLEEARELGDCLIVGLNTDDSIRQLKGSERPFVNEFERAEMLSGFGCVDYVVLFNELTADNIISKIEPDIYTKGGDIAADQIPEAETVKKYGGKIVVLSKTEGKSTTKLVSQVRNIASDINVRSERKDRIAGLIPARLAATRLPNKPLLDIAGKPMIQWVYEHALEADLLDEVLVATPDEEIFQCVESFGGKAIMTSPLHKSGTDRLAEAARKISANIIINIQGDEPLLESSTINMLAEAMLSEPNVPMASLMCKISDPREEEDASVVKVVVDAKQMALYFSRSKIPYQRCETSAVVNKHIGVYAYRLDFLLAYANMEQTPLEIAESLEQLRALENGCKIKMVETSFSPTSVDTHDDLLYVKNILENR